MIISMKIYIHIKVAKQMAVDLNKLFSNFDGIFKKFNALEPPTKREQTLQNNMKLWASQFLQEYLPDFRISHKVCNNAR